MFKILEKIGFLEYIIFICLLLIIFNRQLTITSVKETTELWYFKFFSIMFIFYVFAESFVLSSLGKFFASVLTFPFQKILKLDTSYKKTVYLFAHISGSPGVTGLIAKLHKNNELSDLEANYLAKITSLINPLFFFSVLKLFITDFKILLLMYLAILAANFFVALNFVPETEKKSVEKNRANYTIFQFMETIERYFFILINILGVMIIINLVISFLKHYEIFNFLPINFSNFIFCFLEIITGFNTLSNKYSPEMLLPIASLAAFLGVGIHLQIIMLGKNFLKYSDFLIYKLMHSLLSLIIFYIFLALYKKSFTFETILLPLILFLIIMLFSHHAKKKSLKQDFA